VSGNWFDVSGVKAARGRLFTDGDDRKVGESPVAVLSHQFWLRRFSADPRVLGSTLRLNGVTVTIVGVSAPGFRGSRWAIASTSGCPSRSNTNCGNRQCEHG
jgi:hypothetical protein